MSFLFVSNAAMNMKVQYLLNIVILFPSYEYPEVGIMIGLFLIFFFRKLHTLSHSGCFMGNLPSYQEFTVVFCTALPTAVICCLL